MVFVRKNLHQVDSATGEVLEGLTVLVPIKSKLRDHFTMITGQGMVMLAVDQDLKHDDWRVLAIYIGSMDFENIIRICQKDVADLLGMKKQNVSRSTIKLIDKGILVGVTKFGRSKVYRLNVVYGWKGKITKTYTTLYESDSKLIA